MFEVSLEELSRSQIVTLNKDDSQNVKVQTIRLYRIGSCYAVKCIKFWDSNWSEP